MKTKKQKNAHVKGTANTSPAPEAPPSTSLPTSAHETSRAASESESSNIPFQCPKPTPMELIAAARHLIGNGKFPKSEDARDAILRNALGLWHQSQQLVCDYDVAGSVVTELNRAEREQHMEKWVHGAGPRMEGRENITFITNENRYDRALSKIKVWLESGTVPWGLKTVDDLTSPIDRGSAEALRHCFIEWNAARISKQNARKGERSAAKAKAKAGGAETQKSKRNRVQN